MKHICFRNVPFRPTWMGGFRKSSINQSDGGGASGSPGEVLTSVPETLYAANVSTATSGCSHNSEASQANSNTHTGTDSSLPPITTWRVSAAQTFFSFSLVVFACVILGIKKVVLSATWPLGGAVQLVKVISAGCLEAWSGGLTSTKAPVSTFFSKSEDRLHGLHTRGPNRSIM